MRCAAFSRRDLLKQSAAAATAVAWWPTIVPSSVLGGNAPSNRVNLAAIGVGGRGSANCLQRFLPLDDVRLVAAVDCRAKTRGEAFAKREAGAFILDVRQPEEWQEYHVPGSTLIPLGELEGRVDELPRDQEIVVVCRSGNRSQAGRDTLKQAGFSEVTSMTGGVSEWRASGYPTETGN
jgi:rhodanese-related sulfurtransferase